MAKGKKAKQKARQKYIFTLSVLLIIAIVSAVLLGVEYRKPGTFPFLQWVFEEEDTPQEQGGDRFQIPNNINIEESLIVYFFDVGQGDSTLLRFPDGTDILIDAGSGANASAKRISTYLNYLSEIKLDNIEYMIATHPDSDHINMLDDVLITYEVESIYYNGYMHTSATFNKFVETANAEVYNDGKKAQINLFDGDGDIITITGDNFVVTIYAPGYERFEGTNTMSPIIVAEYGGRKLVLSGDAEAVTEQWFIELFGDEGLDCDLLKVGHHGSKTSSSPEFLDFITCEYSVISLGVDNSYGHPHHETLINLTERGYTIYRTDINGNIACYIDKDGDIAFVTKK